MGCGVLLAGTVHAVKAGSRPVMSAATAGMADPVVSTIEDVIATVTSFLAVIFPYLLIVWVILLSVLIYLFIRRRRQRRAATLDATLRNG
jgi:chromate transport protein ChrA